MQCARDENGCKTKKKNRKIFRVKEQSGERSSSFPLLEKHTQIHTHPQKREEEE